jgi:solute carrier family 8 (sodium/calcium exchanger)
MCIVELVPDAKSKKEADAMQTLMDRIEGEEKLTWGEQMKKAVMLHPGKDDDGNIEDVSNGDAIFHFISVFWKVVFSLCPPPHYGGGFPCFIIALIFIGLTTFVVAEIATLMGCIMGLKPGVTAITFVAIGTSIPDTFASRIAAQQERYGDEAVGNVTGSNSVNVFLGLGLPWVIASIYYESKGEVFNHPAKGLDLSVLLFLILSLIGIAVLVIRRQVVGGELGGSARGRYISAFIFISLWFIYVIVSSLAQYEIIKFPE